MDTDLIRELAVLLNEQGLSVLEFDNGSQRVRLERTITVHADNAAAAAIPVPAAHGNVPAVDPGMDFNEMKTVSSPLVGVFYSAPAPSEPPFVQVGDIVKKGDVLCIVEAMKVMNEITAECAGQIVDIPVQNGDVVEFGQTLFKLV